MSAVVAVSRSATHTFTKPAQRSIRLLTGLGVEGDAHAGTTVRHRSRVAKDPTRPNLRQVHLISQELLGELGELGYRVGPGELGENVTTSGLDLVALPTDTLLVFPGGAAVRVTGLRNPCHQINRFRPGLLGQVIGRDDRGEVVRRAGIMGVVVQGGEIRPGDTITVELPTAPHSPLVVV
ncbi:MOSC domain-containing protein [Actinoalloteichus caeruleus]|uniref:MOSC domain-containing protein n=1 Tax=Actinoalloteichus caeruleus DSM 43889 TaxID=1120930 RepID=A0ABT1JH70_ACTCY|nr:MOSC domain-containing protein [Actinoalloteichus caeruleus]MCP2331845.1 MOSC domain-containing protein [Actinoalloteichus caeruleus DSM 43889]